jgi:2-methylisocitrate lyase-like PEP mutase family enzyme
MIEPGRKEGAGGHTRTLRALLAGNEMLIVPGAADALTARLIEQAGYKVCYFTGAGFANTQFALPDVGLVTLTEVVEQLRRIVFAVGIPVIADADTGYGNALNVIRTVQLFEAAGAAGLQLEDQVSPKRCGHFNGKAVVSVGEMVKKIAAAVSARTDPDFVIVARTDARAVEGLDAALERARQYAQAGADVLFVEAPSSEAELERIPHAVPERPHLVNMVVGGLTPQLPAATLAKLGFRVALYPNVALQAAARAVAEVLDTLHRTGDLVSIVDRMITWEERQALVGLERVQELERLYLELPAVPSAGEATLSHPPSG